MHWQLGEQEMSMRANAPVFQLHPSATGATSPPGGAPATPHFTPASVPGVSQNSGGGGQQQQQQPQQQQQQQQPHHHQVHPPGPPQLHQRGESQTQQRRRNGSFGRRRSDGARTRSSLPPQPGLPLPQLQPVSEGKPTSGGVSAAPVVVVETGQKRDRESVGFVDPYLRKRRKVETDSRGTRSPESVSQGSGNGSVKKEGEEEERTE